jgi:hypothetical protein
VFESLSLRQKLYGSNKCPAILVRQRVAHARTAVLIDCGIQAIQTGTQSQSSPNCQRMLIIVSHISDCYRGKVEQMVLLSGVEPPTY